MKCPDTSVFSKHSRPKFFMIRCVALGLGLLMLGSSCGILESDEGTFIPGEVVFSVPDSIPVSVIEEFVRRSHLRLKALYVPSHYLVFVQTPPGTVETYQMMLAADSLIIAAHSRGEDDLMLVVSVAVAESTLRAALARYGGVEWKGMQRSPILVTLQVPRGQEEWWVKRLQRMPFVITAERNQRVILRKPFP